MSVANPREGIPIERALVTLIALMDTKVMEVTLAVASPIAPIVLEGRGACRQPMVYVVPRKPIIMEVAREKEPVMADPPVI